MEETTHLKNEIDRLNQIINNLNELIGILKTQNTFLKNKIGVKNSNDTIANFENGIKNINDTNVDLEKGTNYSLDIFPDLDNGVKNRIDANANSEKGIKSSLDTIPDFDSGIKQNINTNANIGSGIKRVLVSNTETAKHPIEIENGSKTELMEKLQKILPQSMKVGSAFRIAGELLLIHNNGHASYSDLRKISGLSKPGFAKHAPKLKRRGLIMRLSHKKYVLTQQTKDIIAKTFPA